MALDLDVGSVNFRFRDEILIARMITDIRRGTLYLGAQKVRNLL